MRTIDYIKGNKIIIIGNLIAFLFINAILFASIDIKKGLDDILYIDFLTILIELVTLLYSYKRKKSQYEMFMCYIEGKENIDKIIEKTENMDVQILGSIIKKYRSEFIIIEEGYKKKINELQDYMTQWVHDIKVNIAVSELLVQEIQEIQGIQEGQDKNNSISKIFYQIEQIKFRINQVLNVSRATHYSNDILSERIEVSKELKIAIRDNGPFFINKNIEVNTNIDQFEFISDKKWINYIFTQILNNCSKYTGENGEVNIFTEEDKKAYYVHIRDNGIGISTEDISRVFYKGFTGKNGRVGTKSTGMGLYYVSAMAKILGIGIDIKSVEGQFTEFILSFYKFSDYYNVTAM